MSEIATVYAEDVNYWKTGQTAADTWIDNAKKEIRAVGGQILREAFGSDEATGNSTFMLSFRIGDDTYKILWPVLPSKAGNTKAARIQAATMLYHDVKAKCMTAKVFGVRTAFLPYVMLTDGRTVSQAADSELMDMPRLLALTESARS